MHLHDNPKTRTEFPLQGSPAKSVSAALPISIPRTTESTRR